MWPVSETSSPSEPATAVTVRTGRISAAGGGLSQAPRRAKHSQAKTAVDLISPPHVDIGASPNEMPVAEELSGWFDMDQGCARWPHENEHSQPALARRGREEYWPGNRS